MLLQQWRLCEAEEKTSPRKLKCIAKGLETSGFGIVEYSVRSESGRMIVLRDQAYCVPGLPKYFHIIYPQCIQTLQGYKGTLTAYFNYEYYGYAEIIFKEDKPGWQ